MFFNYPYYINKKGLTASLEDLNRHIIQLIEQVLFTIPGERVNRPTFGSGVYQLVFAPNSQELAAAAQALVQGSLQQWLFDLIDVQSVEARSVESLLEVSIKYRLRDSQEIQTTTLVREV
jgi:Bacteriophage baseplate protein W